MNGFIEFYAHVALNRDFLGNNMDFLTFDNVSFTYPLMGDEIETDENGKPILPSPVFDYFTASLPGGFTSLIGPNASGKSTFMLLAGGRVKPQQGKVLLFGKDIAALDEASRSRLASFIYQNMEFEQDAPVKSLLEQVQTAGATDAAGTENASESAKSVASMPPISSSVIYFATSATLRRKILS